jgi:hypothetical protein
MYISNMSVATAMLSSLVKVDTLGRYALSIQESMLARNDVCS